MASERSGTNLLRVLLGNHREISAPVAPHFFNTFYKTINRYGDLQKPENSELLLSHFIQSANHAYTDWKLNTTTKELLHKYSVDSFEKAFDALYSEHAYNEGKLHYVVKDNDMFNFVDLTQKLNDYGNVHYIHLYRDPRDHAVSWLRTPLFLHTAYDIALKWDKEQSAINQIKEQQEVFNISYESLIANSEKVMTDLQSFLGLELDKNCFSTPRFNEESLRNEFWKNLSRPIIKTNLKKYVGILKGRDLKILESICKENMQRLNYNLDTRGNWKDYFGFYKKYILPKQRRHSRILNKEFFNEKMKDLRSKIDLLNGFENEIENKKNR